MRVGIYRRGRIWWARWTQDGKKSYRSLQTGNRKIAAELGLRLQKRLLLGDEPGKRPVRSGATQRERSVTLW